MPGSPSRMMHQSWPGVRRRRVSQPSIHLPRSVYLPPQLSVVPWGGLFGPAKMPKEIVDRISREVNAILARPAVRKQLEKLGVQPSGSTPEEFAAFLKEQLVDWGRSAREAGLKSE